MQDMHALQAASAQDISSMNKSLDPKGSKPVALTGIAKGKGSDSARWVLCGWVMSDDP